MRFRRARSSSGGMCSPAAILSASRHQVALLIAQQQHGKRRIVVDDDAAFAVENFAARREDRDLLDAVLLSESVVVIVAGDLQSPQAEGENQKNPQQEVLHCREPELRDFILAT